MSTRRWHRSHGPVVILCAALSPIPGSAASAQSSVVTGTSGWEMRLSPYLWAAGLEGRVGALTNLPTVRVDASFSDLLAHTDLALMLAAEIRRRRVGLLIDMNYLSLSADADTSGSLFRRAELEQKTFFGNVQGAYRLVDNSAASSHVTGGLRFWRADTKLSFTSGLVRGARADTTEAWVDPIVGLRTDFAVGNGLAFSAIGDLGGFGIASEFTWQVIGLLRYEVSDRLHLVAGYRHLDVDYQKDGFVWDIALSGPIIGATIRF